MEGELDSLRSEDPESQLESTMCEDGEKENLVTEEEIVVPEKTKVPIMFKTEDTVDQELLEKLGSSEAIKELLRNPHLRNFLKEVDESDKPWKAMKAAMQEPLFLEFADECLKVVEPSE